MLTLNFQLKTKKKRLMIHYFDFSKTELNTIRFSAIGQFDNILINIVLNFVFPLVRAEYRFFFDRRLAVV